MTNNTINNVPRELLKTLLAGHLAIGHKAAKQELRTLLSAPLPAGVDVCKCSMSISMLGDGCRHCQPQEYIDRLSEMLDEERAELSDAQAIIDGLRGEVGAQRIKTCTALKERNDAREERDSFQRIGIRQIEHRYQLAALLLEKFPRIDPHHPITLSEVDHCCEYVLHKDRERLHCAIDAALSAGKEGE